MLNAPLLTAAVDAFKIPDLRRKLIFTLAMLLIFRIVAHIPVPGVDAAALDRLLQENQLLGMLNLFSGSALRQFSIAAMGVYPYITASIIMQLLGPIIPRLEELQRVETPRKPTRPTAASRVRRVNEKRLSGVRKKLRAAPGDE